MLGTTTALRLSSPPTLRDRNTLGASHAEAVRQLSALSVPLPPSVYDTRRELGSALQDYVDFLRLIVDTLAPVFECAADDAADFGGARVESFDLIRAAAEDFIAPLTVAAEHLIDEG